MCSKDNDYFPKNLRESFGNPFEYDVNGTRVYSSLLGKVIQIKIKV